jgi:predicted DNA-binding transcriptional regulator YafY
MAKKPQLHPHSDRLSFARIMLLLAVLVKYPGIGVMIEDDLDREKGHHHNALGKLQEKIQELGQEIGMKFKENSPGLPTIRKDLETLRNYGILERRMYRWGYYLGTGAMTKSEFKTAFDALKALGTYQGDPRIKEIYDTLTKRLKGFELDNEAEFFYPVRQNISQVINYTNPEEMMRKKQNRHTLYHQIHLLENAIIKGKVIEISRITDLYNNHQDSKIGIEIVWPLQLIYHDISWYLVYEKCKNSHLVIGRLNRFSDYCEVIPGGRGIKAQQYSLSSVYELLNNGWGLFLGEQQEQELELRGKLEFIQIKVRFYPPVSNFIREGEKRHLKQKIISGKKDPHTNKPSYIDYHIELPPRSLNEFMIWLQKYGSNVEVIQPALLRQQHLDSALALISRYSTSGNYVESVNFPVK